MLRSLRWIGMTGLMLASTSLANAGIITFDDLPDPNPAAIIPTGYSGLTWSNYYYVNTTEFSSAHGPSGYSNGLVSGTNVAYNFGGTPASFSSLTAFNLNSTYLNAAWNDGMSVAITASLGGVMKYSVIDTVSTTGPNLLTFNWTDIDTVTITTSGGTNHGYNGSGTQFVIDNLSISPFTSVPEPSSLILVSIAGLIGVTMTTSRRRFSRSSV